MPNANKHFDKYSESYEKMSFLCPEWLFGRLVAANWSWCSAMRIVRRKTGVDVDFRFLHALFDGDKKACAHFLWEKYKAEYKRIWDIVHA